MRSYSTFLVLFLVAISSSFGQGEVTSPSSSPGEEATNESTSDYSAMVEQRSYLEEKIEKRSERIQSLYFIEKEVFVGYAEGSQMMTQAVKKHIYKAGETLIEYNNALIADLSEDNMSERIKLLTKIDEIQDQLIFLSRQPKTRPLEKKLRKLKTPEEISPVFFTRD